MSDVSITDLIAEAESWRAEDPDDPNTEEVSARVTSLIGRLADALESVTAPTEPVWKCEFCGYPWPTGEGNPNAAKYAVCSICGADEWEEI